MGVSQTEWLLDWRIAEPSEPESTELESFASPELDREATDLVLNECPAQWEVLQLWRHQARQTHQPVALAYALPESIDPIYKWRLLLGVAKHVSKVGEVVTLERLGERLEVSDRTVSLGLLALEAAGFAVNRSAIDVRIRYAPENAKAKQPSRQIPGQPLARFLAAVQEENFRRQYFYRAPVSTLQAAIGTDE